MPKSRISFWGVWQVPQKRNNASTQNPAKPQNPKKAVKGQNFNKKQKTYKKQPTPQKQAEAQKTGNFGQNKRPYKRYVKMLKYQAKRQKALIFYRNSSAKISF